MREKSYPTCFVGLRYIIPERTEEGGGCAITQLSNFKYIFNQSL